MKTNWPARVLAHLRPKTDRALIAKISKMSSPIDKFSSQVNNQFMANHPTNWQIKKWVDNSPSGRKDHYWPILSDKEGEEESSAGSPSCPSTTGKLWYPHTNGECCWVRNAFHGTGIPHTRCPRVYCFIDKAWSHVRGHRLSQAAGPCLDPVAPLTHLLRGLKTSSSQWTNSGKQSFVCWVTRLCKFLKPRRYWRPSTQEYKTWQRRGDYLKMQPQTCSVMQGFVGTMKKRAESFNILVTGRSLSLPLVRRGSFSGSGSAMPQRGGDQLFRGERQLNNYTKPATKK